MHNQGPFVIASAIVCINGLITRATSHPRTQNLPVSGIAYNFILIRIAQSRHEAVEATAVTLQSIPVIEREEPVV